MLRLGGAAGLVHILWTYQESVFLSEGLKNYGIGL